MCIRDRQNTIEVPYFGRAFYAIGIMNDHLAIFIRSSQNDEMPLRGEIPLRNACDHWVSRIERLAYALKMCIRDRDYESPAPPLSYGPVCV